MKLFVTRLWSSKIHRSVLIAAVTLFAVTLAVYAVYAIHFWGLGLGGQEEFGQFGDFVGGVLNPLLSSITIILLVLSFRIQADQLKQAEEAHRIEMRTNRQERERHQLEDFAEHHFAALEKLFTRAIFYAHHRATTSDPARTKEYSIRDLCLTVEELRDSYETKFFIHLEDPDLSGDPRIIETVREIQKSLHLLHEVVTELMPLLDVQLLRAAWRQRLIDAMQMARKSSILDLDTYSRRASIITLAVLDPQIAHNQKDPEKKTAHN